MLKSRASACILFGVSSGAQNFLYIIYIYICIYIYIYFYCLFTFIYMLSSLAKARTWTLQNQHPKPKPRQRLKECSDSVSDKVNLWQLAAWLPRFEAPPSAGGSGLCLGSCCQFRAYCLGLGLFWRPPLLPAVKGLGFGWLFRPGFSVYAQGSASLHHGLRL